MSTHINGLALQRMHWIGLLAAILVWVLGVTEVGGNATIWFFKKAGSPGNNSTTC